MFDAGALTFREFMTREPRYPEAMMRAVNL